MYGDVFRRIVSEEAQYREAGRGDDDQLPEFGMPIQLILMILHNYTISSPLMQDCPRAIMKR